MGEFAHFANRGLWPQGRRRLVAQWGGGRYAPLVSSVGHPGGSSSRGRPGSDTAELLCALSYGSGLAVAERMEHGTNTAFVGIQLGRALGLGMEDLEAVFYGVLIKDVGCGACGALLAPFVGKEELAPRLDLVLVDPDHPRGLEAWATGRIWQDPALSTRLARLAAFASQCGSVAQEAMTAHCEIAADFAAGLGFGRHVQDAVHYQYERYDGRGPGFGRAATTIPRPAQILHLALAADMARSFSGAEGAAAMVRQRTGSYFDPQVAEAYLDLDLSDGLWPPGDEPILLADVLSCDPGTPADNLPGDRTLAVCEALADFADLKSAQRGRHSFAVAGLAATAAARLGLPEAEQDRLRRAGLVHDLGKIAVPYRVLEQTGDDTSVSGGGQGGRALAESVRMHSYYAQRILSQVPPLANLATDVGAHHERIDGSGYPLGLSGQAVPIGARVLAAADTWAERAGISLPDLSGERGLDPACTKALASSAQPQTPYRHQCTGVRPVLPPLSPRELEVLRQLSEGASNPDISKALYISRRTVEHHVEHILTKLGVTSRTAAVAYGLTHDLLA
jgi:HD-GYP domain-containing protein (c-di-GMP phosphodiesterase class II)/DNA-binding CsgD family transcriptional regulator